MGTEKEVRLPDIGDFEGVEVIEVLVSPGDRVEVDQSILTLESDKATMEIPAPWAGEVKELKVAIGDTISEGDLLLVMDAEEGDDTPPAETSESSETGSAMSAPAAEEVESVQAPAPAAAEPPPAPPASVVAERPPGEKAEAPPPVATLPEDATPRKAHASPAVRRFARELGVDLLRVKGSGPKGRITKFDVQNFVKQSLAGERPAAGAGMLPEPPRVDYAKFGEVERKPLGRIKKISGAHLHRSWITVPHVTQFDEADITKLEAFRQEQKEDAAKQGVRLTLFPFMLKACAAAMAEMPIFNASLDADGEHLVYRKYCNIGVAVDTPNGLVEPVIRDVDKKGVFELARELGEMSARARDGKLTPADLQGGCFSISSLGGIGGTAFTPIINAPEVAILGVSRASMKPVWDGEAFQPRLMLPLSLSYDHRVIDGADGVRFTTFLAGLLSDIRRLLL